MKQNLTGCAKLLPEIKRQFSVDISVRTIQRLAHDSKLRWGKPRARPPLHSVHKAERLDWCNEHKDWTVEMWKQCVFADEKIFRANQGLRALRYKIGQRPTSVKKRDHKKFHVWWAIHMSTDFPVIEVEGTLNAEGYCKILTRAFKGRFNNSMLFLHDNAPPHSAKLTVNYLKERSIRFIGDFPPYSPDLNPIENLWSFADYHFKIAESSSRLGLLALVRKELRSISKDLIAKYIFSMPRRVKACIEAEGGYTKY